MSYLRPNLAGVYDIPSINVSSQLYVRGVPFETYVGQLETEDQFEQAEITELKLLVQYLDTAGLNTAWIVDNQNKNQDLKTAITAIQTKLAQIDTTALTESSVLDNDNRNSVLKSRLDTNDGNVTTLTNKTRYVTVNHNSGALENEAYMSIDPIAAGNRTLEMRVGANHELILQNYPSTPTANFIALNTLGGKILLDASMTEIDSRVDMGKFDGSRDGREFRIGGAMSKIRIGSVNNPIVGTGVPVPDENFNDTTEIHIGKQTALKNTKTYLNGNIYTDDGRFQDLDVTDVITWEQPTAWLASYTFSFFSLPYWIAWAFLSGTPNYRYSDVVKMANNYLTGGLTKNHSIETSNNLALKTLTVVNTDLISLTTPFDGLLNRLVFQAFAIHGSHHMGVIRGSVKIYAGDGEVELRNDGGIVDFALKDAGNTNWLKLYNTDVELIQCNGTSAVTNKLILGACCGNIEMITATTGIRANATKVLEVKGNKQVKIGNNSDAIVDDTYKVLIDAASHTNGIKLIKGTDTTLINPKNISTKTITFQDYPLISSGETVNTLYTTDGGAKLYYGEHLVAPFSALGAQGAGAIFIFRQADNITNNQSILNDMVSAYTSTATRTNTVSNYVVHTPIPMGSYLSPYLDNTINSLLHGNYEANIFGLLNANQHCFLHVELAHIAERVDNTVDFIIDKSLTYTTDVFTSSNFFWKSQPLKIPTGRASLVMNRFVMSQVEVTPDFTGTPIELRMRIRNNLNDVLYTSSTITANGFDTTTADRIFTFSPAVSLVLTTASFIVFEFEVINTQVPNLLIRQRKARSAQDMVYKLGGSWYVRLYDGVNNKVLLNAGGGLFGGGTPVSYNIPIPLPAVEPYDISQFGHYSKVQLNVFFTQPSGQQAGNSFSIYTGDGYLSHVQTTINIGGGTSSSTGGASSGTNNVQRSVVEDELAPVAGSGNTPPEDRLIASTVIIPRKNLNYLNGWIDIEGIPQSNTHNDCYMSDTGRFILTAMGTSSVVSQLNLNRFYASEAPWQGVGLSKNWKSCCGSAIGNRMYAVAAKSNNDAANALYTSINYGVTWTVLANTPAEFKSNNTIGQVRCDGVGRNVFISSMTTTQVYRSDDFGVSWQTITIGTGVGTTPSIAVNSVGQYVFATLPNIGVYRSFDFGLTFQLINNSATAWLNISCSATAQYVVATRSGATYAYSDDYGSTWTFGSDTYVDAAMAHSGNLVVFCNNGNIAYSDNNGYSIRATRNTGRNHQSIVINANGQFGLAPLVSPVTEGGSTFEAMLFREPDDNVKNISAGTGITIANDLNGGYTITASAVGSSSAVQFVSRMSWTGQTSQTLPTLDLINYDYEMIVEIQNVSVNAWIYLYWNGGGTGTFIGDMVYPANPSTYQAGTDQQVPYYMNNSSTTYFIQVGTTAVSAANRSVLNRYRLRGISSTRFALNIMGRQQLYWSDNNTITNLGMPSGGTYLASSVWYNSANNANWGPTAITFNGQGASAPVTVTWLRINKVSSA
jgi:hypothetical protein